MNSKSNLLPTIYYLRIILYWLPSLLYIAVIYYLSSQPAPEAVRQVPIFSGIKLVHLAEYGILCALFIFALVKTGGGGTGRDWSLRSILWTTTALTILAGIFDEVHQCFVPSRTGTLIDVVTDGIAAVLVCTLYTISLRVRKSE